MNKEQREIVTVTGRLLWLASHHRGVLHTQLDAHEQVMLAAHTLLVDMLDEEYAAISGARRKMKRGGHARRQEWAPSLVGRDACSDAGWQDVTPGDASDFQECGRACDAGSDVAPSSCARRKDAEKEGVAHDA